jgi:hypothetical protein
MRMCRGALKVAGVDKRKSSEREKHQPEVRDIIKWIDNTAKVYCAKLQYLVKSRRKDNFEETAQWSVSR